ncbi:MAG: LamG domain-containing protein, partial [Sedimentisphaerales bacterium]|nr:LamG domain-containing protein [Sedimentisphaerales bacterium]
SVIGPFDLEGNPRIADGDGDWEAVVDIGAYESPAAVLADIDDSGRVDYLDFGLFSSEWLADNMQLFEYEESAWWLFDEGFGTIVYDHSVYDRDGTLSDSAPRWTTSDLNGVLIFDGVSNYVEVVGYKGVTGTQSRTCTAWVKTTYVGGVILSWGDYNVNGARWLLKTDESGALRISVGGGNIIGSKIITDDQWHFVAAVLEDDGSPNADEIKLYVDGVEDTNTTFVSHEITEGTTNADVLIGAFYYAGSYYYYEGIIDDVRIYEFALSDEMIELIHNRQSPSRLVCTEYPQADVNHDCAVDVDDLRIFAEKWLWQQ